MSNQKNIKVNKNINRWIKKLRFLPTMQIKYRGAAVQISAMLPSRDVTGPGQKRLSSQIRPRNLMCAALRKRLD